MTEEISNFSTCISFVIPERVKYLSTNRDELTVDACAVRQRFSVDMPLIWLEDDDNDEEEKPQGKQSQQMVAARDPSISKQAMKQRRRQSSNQVLTC